MKTLNGSDSPNGAFAQIGTVIRAPKTAELIATNLRRQIVRGELLPGNTLPPEVQLMEQYGVSRPTLREAFRILEAEAIISVRRGSRGGAQVIAPDVSVAARYVGLLLQIQGTTVNDVYEARMTTEPPCARLFALRRTDKDIEQLTEVVEQLKVEVKSRKPFIPDPDTWSRLTYRFHELILQGCGNKTLAIQGAVLQDVIATHLRAKFAQGYESEPSERFQRVIRSYTKFIALIKVGNAAGAEKHWLAHMEGAAQYLLKDDLKTKRVVDLFS
jgi:DNA-binding FadR family transcriptional regulator